MKHGAASMTIRGPVLLLLLVAAAVTGGSAHADITPGEYSLELAAPTVVPVGSQFTLSVGIYQSGMPDYESVQWDVDYGESIVDVVSMTKDPLAPSECLHTHDNGSRVLLGCFAPGVDLSHSGNAYNVVFSCVAPGVASIALQNTSGGSPGDGLKTWVMIGTVPQPVHTHNPATSVTCVPTADIATQKSGPSSVPAGQNVTYTVTGTNTGPYPWLGGIVADDLPDNADVSGCAVFPAPSACATLDVDADGVGGFEVVGAPACIFLPAFPNPFPIPPPVLTNLIICPASVVGVPSIAVGGSMGVTVNVAAPAAPCSGTLTDLGIGMADSPTAPNFGVPGTNVDPDFLDGVDGSEDNFDPLVTTVTGCFVYSISLSPPSATNPVGTMHTVTATLSPVAEDVPVTFSVTGANSAAGAVMTNSSGEAEFTYQGTAVGLDSIAATAPGYNPAIPAAKTWEGLPDSGFMFTVAGGAVGDGLPGTSAILSSPQGVARDAAGNIFVADTAHHRVRKVSASLGSISTVAGNGTASGGIDGEGGAIIEDDLGDGGVATGPGAGSTPGATLNEPRGLALNAAGTALYIADSGNARVRRLNLAANPVTITTVAGGGPGCNNPCAALQQALGAPSGVALDAAGNVFIADATQHRVYRVDTVGTITTIAGTGAAGFTGDGGSATAAMLQAPLGAAVDGSGNVFIADTGNNRVRRVAGSTITTVAGGGGGCVEPCPGPNQVLGAPSAVAVDGSGRILIADTDSHRVRRLSAGTISTVAGTGSSGFSGDGGGAPAAELAWPRAVAAAAGDDFVIADTGNERVRKVTAGTIASAAGKGSTGYCIDGVPALGACLAAPSGARTGSDLLIADRANNRVHRVSELTSTVTRVAGSGVVVPCAVLGDAGPAVDACLDGPSDAIKAPNGDIYIADAGNGRVRRISGTTITTYAGGGPGCAEPCPAVSQLLGTPRGLAVDAGGALYIADDSTHRVYRVTTGGTITTYAGSGIAGYNGDNIPATAADLNAPSGLALDSAGNLFIADTGNHLARRVDAVSVQITTVVGTGTAGYNGEGLNGASTQLSSPGSVAIKASTGDLFIADTNNHRIRRLDGGSGDVFTVAGRGEAGYCRDSQPPALKVPAIHACLNAPAGVSFDGDSLIIADAGNNRVRRVPSDCDLDGIEDSIETGVHGTDPCLTDTDNDGCADSEEVGANESGGGLRSPLEYFDWYDVAPANPINDRGIDLADTLLVLQHFGHAPNGDALDDDIDRFIPNMAQPWRTAASNDGVDLQDALANLQSFGHTCVGPP